MFVFMTIHPDGSFDITEEENSLLNMQPYQDCISAFETSENVDGIIRYPDGRITVIAETNLVAIPEIDKIYANLAAKEKVSRSA